MSKSYKDANKQPKKNNPSKIIRIQYELSEAEKDINKYVGNSFLATRQEDENESV